MREITLQLCPPLTMSLPHLQQDGLLQHDRESLVLLVLLVIDDLHIQQLPESRRVKEQGEDGAKQGRRNQFINII